MLATSCNVLLIFPRFELPSFWNYHTTCWVAGKRHPAPPLGLVTVAALLPSAWQVRLIDRNIDQVSGGDLAWADLVMTGGMIPQRPDTVRLIELCRSQGKPVMVGGPDVTSSPHAYSRADFQVLGEAELVMDDFVAAWESGARQGIFEAEKYQADVTKSPIPRFDLLNKDHYLHLSVQFSRGCPFTCEFCDIIELFGRVPRAKGPEQVLAELDAIYDRGYRGNIDFVDDNLIGNKKAVKAVLPHLIEWQKERGYPFAFTTQASINLADDAALLQLMRDANFFAVFIGIESPNTDTLISTQKKQNIRRSIADCIHKIYEAGIFVVAGFIVGFDTEKDGVAEEMVACIEEAAIPICMIGELTALPNTQLWRRLEKEGRLNDQVNTYVDGGAGDICTGGLNFVTARPRRDILADYRTVLERSYAPEAFFARLQVVGRTLRRAQLRKRIPLRIQIHNICTLARLVWWVSLHESGSRLRFARALIDCARHNPGALEDIGSQVIIYLHVGAFSRDVIAHLDREIAAIDASTTVPLRPLRLLPKSPRPVGSLRDVGRRVASRADGRMSQ